MKLLFQTVLVSVYVRSFLSQCYHRVTLFMAHGPDLSSQLSEATVVVVPRSMREKNWQNHFENALQLVSD